VADVNLSKAVRSNLLSLQSTAASMAKTQERLATGLKVNSALDNPTNFFTAASLNSRAGDMSNLLDSMSNGIKTIEAADNGLSSITKTVESMQSTLRQARQDKSFKTQSFAVDSAASGNISFSGGAIGAAPVNVALGSGTTVQSTFAATADYEPPLPNGALVFEYTSDTAAYGAGQSFGMTLTVDGSPNQAFTLNAGIVGSIGDNDNSIENIDELTDAMNAAIAADIPSAGVTVANDGQRVYIMSDTVGGSSSVQYSQMDWAGGFTASYGAFGSASQPPGAASKVIEISDGSQTASITLTTANAFTMSDARDYIQGQLDALGMDITVGGAGTRIDLAGASDGSNTITVGGADAGTVFGASGTQTAGSTSSQLSVDQIVQSINTNTSLKDKIRASNDNGKLRIENLSTEALEIGGIGTDGEIDGTSGTADIGGNEVRKNLVKQFNELRDQLDKLADDASFNGINLLRGDKLKLTFNESGTSTIDIQAKDADGDPTSVNNATLGITSAVFADFDSDASLDARLGKLGDALGKLRSQASAFGSNLSIVENRNDFTKSMINTLETGAANLTLADTNQEAANLLALQTRQQLSSTALSMASQADQAVLRLF